MAGLQKAFDSFGNAVRTLVLPRVERIGRKIDGAYAAGEYDKAARWDERLEKYLDNRENYEAALVADGPEVSERYAVDDEGTDATLAMAGRYADYISYPGAIRKEYLVENLREIAQDGTRSWPTPKTPKDEDVFEYARQAFESRQQLREKYRRAKRVVHPDELIKRLGVTR